MSISFVSATMKRRLMRGEVPNWMLRHIRCSYIRSAYLAAPLWVTRSMFDEHARVAKRETAATGVRHVLDHDVPISHPFVCGLTVPWNVKVIPASVNAAKSNRWHPEQVPLDLRHTSHQKQLAL